jgi:hypothetical protein
VLHEVITGDCSSSVSELKLQLACVLVAQARHAAVKRRAGWRDMCAGALNAEVEAQRPDKRRQAWGVGSSSAVMATAAAGSDYDDAVKLDALLQLLLQEGWGTFAAPPPAAARVTGPIAASAATNSSLGVAARLTALRQQLAQLKAEVAALRAAAALTHVHVQGSSASRT